MTIEENREALLKTPKGWEEFFAQLSKEEEFLSLVDKVAKEAGQEKIYPPLDHVYQALERTAPANVKVVILGQDPYFHEGQANGLAFSVGKGTKLPPSLVNIYKELSYEYGYPIPKENGDLSHWADQGVLLLNASLTVRDGEPNSHADYGWDKVTDKIIQYLDSRDQYIVYLLWGSFAQKKAQIIRSPKAFLIKTAHPSPLSASKGFFCSDCFYRANRFLKENGLSEIDFQIKDEG